MQRSDEEERPNAKPYATAARRRVLETASYVAMSISTVPIPLDQEAAQCELLSQRPRDGFVVSGLILAAISAHREHGNTVLHDVAHQRRTAVGDDGYRSLQPTKDRTTGVGVGSDTPNSRADVCGFRSIRIMPRGECLRCAWLRRRWPRSDAHAAGQKQAAHDFGSG